MIETAIEFKESRFFNYANPNENNALHIIRIGHNTAKPGYSFGPYVQANFNFFFIMQGSLNFHYENSMVQLQAGDMCFGIKENRYYYEMAPSELPLKKIWIAFHGSQIPWIMQELNLTAQKPYARQVVKTNAKSILQTMLNIMKEVEEPDQFQLVGLFYLLISAIKPKATPGDKQSTSYWVDYAKSYIDIHFTEPITLHDICEHVSISRGHLTEVFQQKFGVAPFQYMKDLRMDRALQLITRTSYSITEIAQSVGYHSLFSFSRAFRNHYGYSPNHARASNVKSD